MTGICAPSSSVIRACSQAVRVRLAACLAAAQDQQVGDHAGARGPLVGTAGQPQRADEIGEGGDLAAGGGVAGVHRVPRRQHQ